MKSIFLSLIFSLQLSAQELEQSKIKNNFVSEEEFRSISKIVVSVLKEFNIPFPLIATRLQRPEIYFKFQQRLKEELKKNNLVGPLISEQIEVVPTLSNSFGGSSVVGLSVVSDNLSLCIPCATGWNQFAFGVAKEKNPDLDLNDEMLCAKKVSRFGDGNFKPELKTLVIPFINKSDEVGFLTYTNPNDSFFISLPKSLSSEYRFQAKCGESRLSISKSFSETYITKSNSSDNNLETANCSMLYDERVKDAVVTTMGKSFDRVVSFIQRNPELKSILLDELKSCKVFDAGKKMLEGFVETSKPTPQNSSDVKK